MINKKEKQKEKNKKIAKMIEEAKKSPKKAGELFRAIDDMIIYKRIIKRL